MNEHVLKILKTAMTGRAVLPCQLSSEQWLSLVLGSIERHF